MSALDVYCIFAALIGAVLQLAIPQVQAIRQCPWQPQRRFPWALLLVCATALPAGTRLGAPAYEPLDAVDEAMEEALDAGDSPAELYLDEASLADTAYSVPLTKQRVPVLSRGQTIYKTIFSGQLSVGTPAQPFTVVFDTGSGHLIVPGDSCRSPACLKNDRYTVANSSTGVPIDYDGTPVTGKSRDQLTVSFGTGEVTGVFAQDILCVGQASGELVAGPGSGPGSGPGLCVPAHLIQATEMTDKPFLEFNFDGVLGLGLSGLSQTPAFNMAEQLGGAAGVFAVHLGARNSEIRFGGWRPELLAAPEAGQEALRWSPVQDPEEGYWKLRVAEVRVDGQVLDFCAGGCHAVADTGTSVLAAPTPVVQLMRSRLSPRLFLKDGRCALAGESAGESGESGEEAEAVEGPVVEIVLEGGIRLGLNADDFAQPRLNKAAGPNATSANTTGANTTGANASQASAPSASAASAACELLLMRMDVPEPLGPLFILGEPFLAKYYTVFDVKQKRVGFGLAKQETAETETAETETARPEKAAEQAAEQCVGAAVI